MPYRKGDNWYNDHGERIYNPKAYFKAAGLELPDYLDNETVYTHEIATHYADKIILFNFPNSSLIDDFMKLKASKKHKKKISVIDCEDVESPNYFSISDKIDEIINT